MNDYQLVSHTKEFSLRIKPKMKFTLFIIISILKLSYLSTFESENTFKFKNFKNSIYFSDIDPLSSLDFNSEIQKPHKIDLMILKLENKLKEDNTNSKGKKYLTENLKSKTFLSLKLSKNFYDINFCIDEIDSPIKNQILKYLTELSKTKNKLYDYSHKDLVNILRKIDFSEIDPKIYNDKKISRRYNEVLNIEENADENDKNLKHINIQFEKCFRKFEFLNEDSPRNNLGKSEKFNLIKLINQTIHKHNNEIENDHIFDPFINIKLGDTLIKLKKIINEIIKWEDDNIMIELNFIFENGNLKNYFKENLENNETINKFFLETIFVYFLKMPKMELDSNFINLVNSDLSIFNKMKETLNKSDRKTEKDHYISLIQKNNDFENIFIDYKILGKQIKYSKNFFDNKKHKIKTKSISYQNLTTPFINSFSTLQRQSIFHNRLTFNINLEYFRKEILNTNYNNKICLLIYHHLTEDTYIEKNELKTHLNQNFPYFEKDYFSSEEIDQEVSSDISKQYFVSFSLCTKREIYKTNIFKSETNSEIEMSFPIHFRYQPPLYYTSHQEVFLNLPHVGIFIQEDQNFEIEKYLLNQDFFNFNDKIKASKKTNSRQISRKKFTKEISNRLKYINEINLMLENLDKIRHFIPIAQMQHFYTVLIGTFFAAIIGFFIVMFGVINNKIKEKVN